MTPEQRHQDAVDAAHEWRDHQRITPRRDDKIVIRWPGGPHDFLMWFDYEDTRMPAPKPGWINLHGAILEPAEPRWGSVTLYARFVTDGVYELMPKIPGPRPDPALVEVEYDCGVAGE